MNDIQRLIGAWHIEAFPTASIQIIALKLLEEAIELAVAAGLEPSDILRRCTVEATRDHSGGIDEEICDVMIVAMALASRRHINDLEASITSKHEKNLARFTL